MLQGCLYSSRRLAKLLCSSEKLGTMPRGGQAHAKPLTLAPMQSLWLIPAGLSIKVR